MGPGGRPLSQASIGVYVLVIRQLSLAGEDWRKAVKCSACLDSTWAPAILGLPSFMRAGDLGTIDSAPCTQCMCSWIMPGFILLAGKSVIISPALF